MLELQQMLLLDMSCRMMSLYIHPSLSIHPFIDRSIYSSISPSTHPSLYLTIHPPSPQSIHPYIHLSIDLSMHLSHHLSIYLPTRTSVSFKELILPHMHPVHTDLLPMHPVPCSALRNAAFEAIYSSSFSHFNPIQSQMFHVLYHTDQVRLHAYRHACSYRHTCMPTDMLMLVIINNTLIVITHSSS